MSISFVSRRWVGGVLCVVGLIGAWKSPALKGWHAGAASTAAVGEPTSVQVVTRGTERVGARPGEKGATYYSLEQQTTRLTMQFVDGTKAVAERTIDGTLKTVLTDTDGSEVHRLRLDGTQSGATALSFVQADGQSRVYRVDPGVHPTLDWMNHQIRAFRQDRVTTDTPLQWKNGLMRSAAGAPTGGDVDAGVRLTETVWSNGLAARTMRIRTTERHEIGGHVVTGDVLATKVLKNDVEIGSANYYTGERIYSWHLQNVADGWVANDHLQTRYGGWPFTPDMIWMNLQTMALYHWRSAIDANGFVADNKCSAARPALLARLSNFFEPTLYANDPGCDDFHWLDGTLLRYCCDIHDACYERAGCSSSTWWRWWSSWTCDYCNMNAIACFASGGGTNKVFVPCAC